MSDDKSADNIVSDFEDGILRLAMNRPEKKNALTVAMYQALAERMVQAGKDSRVRVIVIHGTGGSFTSGNDLKDFLDFPPKDEHSPVFAFMTAVSQAEKPIVAAVSGVAAGIGTTMLLHCDLVYAGKSAKFLLPFVNLGLCPEAGSSFLLPLCVGHQHAAELLLLGEPFSAEKAREIGLVNAVLEDAEVLNFAMAQARKLAAQPQASVRLTKAMLKQANKEIVQKTIFEEAHLLMKRLLSPEAREAFSAFLERRKADFSKFD